MARPPRLVGLAPLLPARPRALVLGSMPGAASLAAGRYYAHPQNAFWPMMGELVGAGPELGYAERIARLAEAGIALWDVIGACRRRGSLDSAIDPASIVVNAIVELLAAAPSIERVLTNGGLASTLYRRHVLPGCAALPVAPEWHALPSTSAANASWNRARKLAAWRDALGPVLGARHGAALSRATRRR